MILRRALLLSALIAALPAAASAAVVLIYGNDAAVTAGPSVAAPATDAGAVVPATVALSSGTTMLIGDESGLYHAVLFRLDNDLNVAVMRRGEPVKDAALVGHHLHRWAATAAFLALSSGTAAAAPAPTSAAEASAQPFRAEINGVGTDSTVVLKSLFNKAKFTLKVVNTSTVPVWNMSVVLTSDPKLSFWKEGHREGLNDVPEPELTIDQQALFRPIAPGGFISVNATAYYMKGKDYTWTVKTKSKTLSAQSVFAVRIN